LQLSWRWRIPLLLNSELLLMVLWPLATWLLHLLHQVVRS
jgi:hypothetical protein